MLDQRFFHESIKGGFFIGITFIIVCFLYFVLSFCSSFSAFSSVFIHEFIKGGFFIGTFWVFCILYFVLSFSRTFSSCFIFHESIKGGFFIGNLLRCLYSLFCRTFSFCFIFHQSTYLPPLFIMYYVELVAFSSF